MNNLETLDNNVKQMLAKAEYGRKKRRENKFFGIKRDLNSRDKDRVVIAIKKLSTILNEID